MAIQEQVEILKHGAYAWNKWRAQHKDASVVLNFANLNRGGDPRDYGRVIATSATMPMIISRTATSTLKCQGLSYVVIEPCLKRFRLHPH